MFESKLAKLKEEFIREITDRLMQDESVLSLALIGSHADGTNKALSDIDFIAVVTDEAYSKYLTDDFWFVGENDVLTRHSPGRLVLENMICLDVTVVRKDDLAEERVNPITRRALRKVVRPLFDPENIFQNVRFAIGDEEDTLFTFDEGLEKFFYYAVVAAFRIKRGELWLAHDNIFFDMKQILILLLKAYLGLSDGSWVKGAMEIDHPLADAIWGLFPVTGDQGDLTSSLIDTLEVGSRLASEIDAEGLEFWSDRFEEIEAKVDDILKPMN